MRYWYDLTKYEKDSLKNEFKTKSAKNKIIPYLSIVKYTLYLISFVFFFLILLLIFSKQNDQCYENTCENNLVIFGSLFIICLLTAIITSIIIDKNKKEFTKWLKFNDIIK